MMVPCFLRVQRHRRLHEPELLVEDSEEEEGEARDEAMEDSDEEEELDEEVHIQLYNWCTLKTLLAAQSPCNSSKHSTTICISCIVKLLCNNRIIQYFSFDADFSFQEIERRRNLIRQKARQQREEEARIRLH